MSPPTVAAASQRGGGASGTARSWESDGRQGGQSAEERQARRSYAPRPPLAALPDCRHRRVVMPGRINWDAVDLGGNENPYGPAPEAVQAMMDECFNVSRYAEDCSEELQKLLAAKEGVDEDQIVLGLGGGMILETFVEYLDSVSPVAGGEVVWPRPSYLRLVRKFEDTFGGISIPIDVDENMEHDLPEMAAAINVLRISIEMAVFLVLFLIERGPCVVLVCTVWYTAVCSSAVFVLFRMNSGPCLKKGPFQ